MNIPKYGHIEGIAIIVDINQFTVMIDKAKFSNDCVAQYTRDVLAGTIKAIEEQGGEVVAFMGDAIFGLLSSTESAANACFSIAKDVDRLCEYISTIQEEDQEAWGFNPGGPSLKMALEFGSFDVSDISSNFLGTQKIIIGTAINYASRISFPGDGNRCHIGPILAAMKPFSDFVLNGPLEVKGKHTKESIYTYYEFDLGDIWRGGKLQEGDETFWG